MWRPVVPPDPHRSELRDVDARWSATTRSAASTPGHDRATNQVTANPYTFQYNAAFDTRLESWLEYYYSHTPLNWLKPMKLYISHIHRDTTLPNGSLSMHGYGRAMDITRLYMTSYVDLGGGQREYYTFLAFNARANEIDHNPYGHWTWKWYWGAVASLMHHFNYVLHYHYPGHQDHVHADNAVNSGNSTFSTGSDTQVAFVQASLRNIWGYSTGIDGDWGPQTDSHSRGALARMGRTGGLTTSQANWLAFCEATRRFGTGKQSY